MKNKRAKRSSKRYKKSIRIISIMALMFGGKGQIMAGSAASEPAIGREDVLFERRRTVNLWEPIEAGDVVIRPANKREVTSLLGDKYMILDVHVESKVDNKRLKLDALQGITATNHVVRPTEGLWTMEETMGKVGKPLWEVVVTKLNRGEQTQGFIAFRLENEIKEIELIATEFRPHKIVITL